MCREEMSLRGDENNEKEQLMSDMLRDFTRICGTDYKYLGREGIACSWLDKWLDDKVYTRFGLTYDEAAGVVNKAKRDASSAWIHDSCRKPMKR